MEKEVKDIVNYRISLAKDNIEVAINCLNSNYYKAAANRIYYAIFAAMRAICALDYFDSKKHSGIISYFNSNYIKKHIFQIEFKDIEKAEFIRTRSDYQDLYMPSKDDLNKLINTTKTFINEVTDYVLSKI